MSLTHVSQNGEANMVDVSDKDVTKRQAIAEAFISMQPDTLALVAENDIKKGDVFSVARIAGIQAAKQCSNLIPLCHPLALSKVWVDFEQREDGIKIFCGCRLKGQTGVEMEALTGASVAALTLFDMCKGVDRTMTISGVTVVAKEGGKSGSWGAVTNES